MTATDHVRPLPHTASRAAFPLGGIGTGNVSLGARGELRDWELENVSDKGRHNPYSFFAIHAAPHGGTPVTRVIEAPLTPPHDLDTGYGFDRLAGLPRLEGATMRGAYPLCDIDFTDPVLPVEVSLRAFTPLVPLDVDSSSIPGAILRYHVTNPGTTPVDVSVVGSVSHTAGRGEGPGGLRARQRVRWRETATVRGLDFGIDLPADDLGYGTLALTTTDPSTTAKPQWVVSFWPDGARLFWDDLTADGLLEPEPRATLEDRPRGVFAEGDDGREHYTEEDLLEILPRLRTGSLGIVATLAPGETRAFEFALTWCFPNRARAWNGSVIFKDPNREQVVRNHYATLWPDAWAAAEHLHAHLPALEASTTAFADALYDSTLPEVVTDAIGGTLAVLRSPTVFVVTDPNPELGPGPVMAAWEGSFDHGGACEGTCTHVWSYAQSAAWLFPSLERSARRVEYLLETDAEGAQKFRTNRLFGGPSWFMTPAVDGQLGTFLRLYREWRFSGDEAFLAELWPAARRTLEHAATWDHDGDGLLDGELHNTYDIEFHGIEPLACVYYLAALRAGVRLAQHLGEHALAQTWAARADAAASGIERVLWNGEYYRQVIDDVDRWRYQYGDGVLADQLMGQFQAYVNGLGELLPHEHIAKALRSIVRYNLREDLSDHESTQRAYALGHEGGLLLASWPHGERPRVPFVYSDEVWTGIEHQVATSLVYAGLSEEALRIEGLLRARYDGVVRNPWDEIEWGHHYARSLASWGLLLAFTGASWDAPTSTLSFDPARGAAGELGAERSGDDGVVRALFTTGTGWGRVELSGPGQPPSVSLHVLGGSIAVEKLVLRGQELPGPIHLSTGESHTATTAVITNQENA